jgi:hypothetical protein
MSVSSIMNLLNEFNKIICVSLWQTGHYFIQQVQ